MPHPPLLIDTCALKDDFMRWLKDYNGKKRISPVVYMEFCMYIIEKKGKTIQHVDRLLKIADISVDTFDKKNAAFAVDFMLGRDVRRCRECDKMDWNDCMIAAHAPIAPTLLVTENVHDFPDLGGRVRTPSEVMNDH